MQRLTGLLTMERRVRSPDHAKRVREAEQRGCGFAEVQPQGLEAEHSASRRGVFVRAASSCAVAQIRIPLRRTAVRSRSSSCLRSKTKPLFTIPSKDAS